MVCATAEWLPVETTTPMQSPNKRLSPARRRKSMSPNTLLHEQGFHVFDNFEINQVVPGGKQHQTQDQSKADLETELLDPLAERLTADSFHRVIDQMAAVQHRHREQVDQPQID